MEHLTIKRQFPLKQLNTLHIAAEADSFIFVNNRDILHNIIHSGILHNKNLLILGGGSNILFTDDFTGIVLSNRLEGIQIEREEEEYSLVKSASGESWHKLVMYCVEKNLGGIENLALIPGTVGAAPIQNIGAYGREIKDTLVSVEAVSLKTSETKIFSNAECKFGYRDSIFKNDLKNQYFITAITLKLNSHPVFQTSYGAIQQTLEHMGIKELSVKAIADAVMHIRRTKLPDPDILGNAGSFFKNPEIDADVYEKLKMKFPDMPGYPTHNKIKVAAGWLIEQCGWKGKRIGNTGAHKDQALVLVNYGGATGDEIYTLAMAIKKSVKEKFGLEIEMEVNIV